MTRKIIYLFCHFEISQMVNPISTYIVIEKPLLRKNTLPLYHLISTYGWRLIEFQIIVLFKN